MDVKYPFIAINPRSTQIQNVSTCRVPPISQIEQLNHLQIELIVLDSNTWNHLTVCQQKTIIK